MSLLPVHCLLLSSCQSAPLFQCPSPLSPSPSPSLSSLPFSPVHRAPRPPTFLSVWPWLAPCPGWGWRGGWGGDTPLSPHGTRGVTLPLPDSLRRGGYVTSQRGNLHPLTLQETTRGNWYYPFPDTAPRHISVFNPCVQEMTLYCNRRCCAGLRWCNVLQICVRPQCILF